ncbi:hypothetical protein CSW00_04270 [Pseudomonas asiatica]|nr:hypothetical protein CSW00_04270 [Pseudomonas sp. MR 02]
MRKAAPEEKRSAFYGVMANWGREKHDDGMIDDHSPGYLTLWSIIGAFGLNPARTLWERVHPRRNQRGAWHRLRRCSRVNPLPQKKPAEAGFLLQQSISHHDP